MVYMRKTKDIYISSELRKVLLEIKSESLVASLLLKKRHKREVLVDDCVNYISLSNSIKDRLSYLTVDRIKSIKEKSLDSKVDIWESSSRYHTKAGSFVGKVFKNIPANEVEKFSNLFRAEMNKPVFTFEIVNGDRIKEFYLHNSYKNHNGTLGMSCMKHEGCQNMLDLYSDNKESIKMLVMLDESKKLMGRALLWISDEFKVMDRIYTISDEELSSYFKKWAMANNYYHKKEQNWNNTIAFDKFGKDPKDFKLKLKLDKSSYRKYPYMDTFKFIDDNGFLYNYHPSDPSNFNFKTLCATDGGYQDSEYLKFDSISNKFGYPGDMTYLTYLQIYTFYNNCNYSEINNTYILLKDSVYNDIIHDHIFNEERESFNNRDLINSKIEMIQNREKNDVPELKKKSFFDTYLDTFSSSYLRSRATRVSAVQENQANREEVYVNPQDMYMRNQESDEIQCTERVINQEVRDVYQDILSNDIEGFTFNVDEF